MRETLLITSDSEAATTAVSRATFAFAPDAVAPSLRELLYVGSRSRFSSFVHHRPSERERERTQSAPKLESEGRGFRRERGFAMGWKCAWIRRGLEVRRTPSSPALRYHRLQRAVAPPRGGGERRKGWVGSSWLRSEKEFFSSSSAM